MADLDFQPSADEWNTTDADDRITDFTSVSKTVTAQTAGRLRVSGEFTSDEKKEILNAMATLGYQLT